MSPYNNYNGMINQLYRQKENIDNIINQYSTMQQQPPVQNIINTWSFLYDLLGQKIKYNRKREK